MKPKYYDLSDAETTELIRKRIGTVRELLTEINKQLKEAGGRD
jgi:hypothetical protein